MTPGAQSYGLIPPLVSTSLTECPNVIFHVALLTYLAFRPLQFLIGGYA